MGYWCHWCHFHRSPIDGAASSLSFDEKCASPSLRLLSLCHPLFFALYRQILSIQASCARIATKEVGYIKSQKGQKPDSETSRYVDPCSTLSTCSRVTGLAWLIQVHSKQIRLTTQMGIWRTAMPKRLQEPPGVLDPSRAPKKRDYSI